MIGRRALLGAPLALAAAAPIPPAARPISRMETGWWRARHEAKLAELRAVKPDLIWLGDSITQNFEQDGPQPWAHFRPVWDRFYGRRRAVNLGFKGDATSHLLWRMRNGELDGITPRAAVVLIGANNLGRLHWSAADTLVGIDTVLAELGRRLPRTGVLLLGVLPSERTAWASQTTIEINAGLAHRSYPPGVVFRDVGHLYQHGATLDRSQFYDPLLSPPEPPLHPTAAGMTRLAEAIEPALAPLLTHV